MCTLHLEDRSLFRILLCLNIWDMCVKTCSFSGISFFSIYSRQKEDRSWGLHLCRINNLCLLIHLWFILYDRIWVLKLLILIKLNRLCGSLPCEVFSRLSLKMFKNPDTLKTCRQQHYDIVGCLAGDKSYSGEALPKLASKTPRKQQKQRLTHLK